MSDLADSKGITHASGSADNGTRYYKKDFWSKENLRYGHPHYRLRKSAGIINKLGRDKELDLLDVGCGPAALMPLITPNIQYYGIDISIPEPAPNLIEADFLENPIALGGMRFDVVLAQGVFEYMGSFQSQKFSEIAGILKEHGRFVVSYVNFGHRDRDIYFPYNNVQPLNDFRTGLESYFKVDRFFPTSHNWKHSEPNRKILQDLNMDLNVNIPIISPKLAVEYFFICSPPGSQGRGATN